MNNTVRQVGGALGVATLGTVLTSVYRARVEPLLRAAPGVPAEHVRQAAGSIQATHAELAGAARTYPQAARLLGRADDAFIHAMHLTTLTAAGVLALAGMIVLAWMPRTATRTSINGTRRRLAWRQSATDDDRDRTPRAAMEEPP